MSCRYITPTNIVPAAFDIGSIYQCLTRPLPGTPNTIFVVYRLTDGAEIGTLISWPSADDARRMEYDFEAWRQSRTRAPLHVWQQTRGR